MQVQSLSSFLRGLRLQGVSFTAAGLLPLLEASGACDVRVVDFFAWVHKNPAAKALPDEDRRRRVPAPPPGLATAEEVTPEMKARQRRDPQQWTMSMQQWVAVLEHCIRQPEYVRAKEKKGFVSMYDVNELFVKPWTAGTGCGLSVLVSRDRERAAGMMLSHAWGEDAEELLECVQKYFQDNGISSDIPVWFCVFGNYQPEDGAGPMIQEQIDMRPFAAVIESEEIKTEKGGRGMVAVHTSRADLYSRLWCVHEVDRAVEQPDVEVGGALSEKYTEEVARRVEVFLDAGANLEQWMEAAEVSVNTSKAKCGQPSDERMLVADIMSQQGGFQRLDTVIRDFRAARLPVRVWRLAVARDGRALELASEAAKADRDVVLAAMQQDRSALQHAAEALWADRSFVLEVVGQDGCLLQRAAPALQADRDVVLEAVRQHAKAVSYAAESLQADRGFMQEVVRQKWGSLLWATTAVKADRDVVLVAVRQHGEALAHAAEALQADRDVVLEALRKHWRALKWAAPDLQADRAVVLEALRHSWRALSWASADLKADREVALAAVRQDARALYLAADSLQADPEMRTAAGWE